MTTTEKFYKAGDEYGCTGNGAVHRKDYETAARDAEQIEGGTVWVVTVTLTS
jgi:hypothetical protein